MASDVTGQDLLKDAFFGNVRGLGPMLSWPELEYGGIVQKLHDLEGRFSLR